MAGANVKNYLSNQNSSFFSLEDVDDDEFLKNSRNRTYSSRPSYPKVYGTENGSLEYRKLQLLQEKERVERESLESTERSLCLLRESEDMGISTAEELQRQREQLERTEENLDNINSTLRYTQKKIDGIKSVFGSIKNYITKKPESKIASVSRDHNSTSADKTSTVQESNHSQMIDTVHPALKLRGIEGNQNDSFSVGDKIDHNLDQIALSVRKIKGLAIDLGEEIDSQNELTNRIMDKADKAHISLHKQNKEMNKLMKK